MGQLGPVPVGEESRMGPVPVLRYLCVGQERHIPVLSGNETPLGHATVFSTQEDYLKWQ